MAISLACSTCESQHQLRQPLRNGILRCDKCQTALMVARNSRRSSSLLSTLVTSAHIKERRRQRNRPAALGFVNRWQMWATCLAAMMCIVGLAFPTGSLSSSLEGATVLLGCAMLGAATILIPLRSPAANNLCVTGAAFHLMSAVLPLLALLYGSGTTEAKLGGLPATLINLIGVGIPALTLLYCVRRTDWNKPDLQRQRGSELNRSTPSHFNLEPDHYSPS